MALSTLSGVAAGIRHSTETIGQIGRNGGAVRTGQVLAFRIDDQSVELKLPSFPDVQDGETVTVSGATKNGFFKALAIRNDRTRAVYAIPATPGYVMGGLLVAVGLPLTFILVGVLFIAFGAYTLYQAYTYSQAAQLLKT